MGFDYEAEKSDYCCQKQLRSLNMKPTILISGGSKGIGRAIATHFHREHFDVIICARSPQALEEAREALPGLHTYVCDMADKAAIKSLAAEINERFGALDVLVNNAGTYLPGAIHSEDDSVYETLMATNMGSAYYLTKGLLPGMMQRRSGTIFNIASVAGIKAYDNGGSYSISKFAMVGFSRNLREEMKPYNIRVVTVLPGAVKTASWDGVDIDENRLMPPSDIAALVWNAWSLSDRTVVEDIIVRPALGDL
jgi:NADP-dependent 3-hydroxy acid dehydrogenase YdfG